MLVQRSEVSGALVRKLFVIRQGLILFLFFLFAALEKFTNARQIFRAPEVPEGVCVRQGGISDLVVAPVANHIT